MRIAIKPFTLRAVSLAAGLSLIVLLGASCPLDIPARVPNGNWGGDHVGMVVTDTGATVEYDCAAGTIDEPLLLATDGSFSWQGVHYPGHGGPVRVDEPLNAHPARYTGHATSEAMTLTVTVPDLDSVPQTYTLTRGGNPKVFKCL